MSEFEQNIPDDFWRKAFEEAAETPPPRVWDAVERRLEEDNGSKIRPLWGLGPASSRPFIWATGMAAAVALLLVGWWALRTTPSDNPVASYQKNQSGPVAVAPAPGQASSLLTDVSPNQDKPVTETPATRATDCWPSREQLPRHRSILARQPQETVAFNRNSASYSHKQPVPVFGQRMNRPAAESIAQVRPALTSRTFKTVSGRQATDAQPVQPAQQTVLSVARADEPMSNRMALTDISARQSLSFNPISTSALRLREPGFIQRIVWFSPAEPAMEAATVQPKREAREVWASVSMMPGAFNPSVAIQSAQNSSVQTAFTRADALSNTTVSQPSVNSRASFSVAYQAGAGIQLTERWSVESGVGYLAGRSTVDSPVQTSVLNFQSVNNSYSGQVANLYVDALRNSSRNALSASNNSTANSIVASADYAVGNKQYNALNSYNPQTRQSLSNDYQFVQVPVQVGYQLRPRKRLGLALLGGFLSNIFVRNTVDDQLVVTAKDGVYRPVSWAATVGARFRYRPSRQWSASLAGLYQPSLGSGTRPESTVQTRPTSTGMSFGIDYHF